MLFSELRSLPFIDMWRENAGPRPVPDDDDVQLPGAEVGGGFSLQLYRS